MSVHPFKSRPEIAECAILHTWRGSIAHGMYDASKHPDSLDDKDQLAVVVPGLDCHFGLREFGKRGTREIKEREWDVVAYDTRKFVRMLQQGNPNVLATLWLPESGYIRKTRSADYLIHNRDLFSGRWVHASFVGYAKGQMHKMTHVEGLGYLGAKRKQLLAKYGYDCKNAAHLIRLLRMACEFLASGELLVDRGGLDASELLSVKHGEWSLQQVEEEAKRLFKRADDAYDRSKLPMKPCYDAINDLAVEVVQTALEERGEITSEHCAAEAAAFRETGLAVHDRIAANGLSVKYRLHTRAI